MATIRVLLGIIWLVAFGSSWGAKRNIIGDSYSVAYKNRNKGSFFSVDTAGLRVVEMAKREIGVKESLGNSGLRVDEYNAYVGLKKVAWCASFVSWCFGQAGYPEPRTAWSPSLFPANKIAKVPHRGMVLGIYFPELKRIAHCGIVEKVKNDLVYSIEGNTNINGSREGDGVYRRIRHKRSIYRFAEWRGN